MIIESVGIGILLSFIFTEITGFYTGGIIVPGYLAFFWQAPYRILATVLTSLLTYYFVKFLSNYVIMYSRRRFTACVIIGYLIGWFYRSLFIEYFPVSEDLRVIGYIIPGLLANDMLRQGITATLSSLAVVSIFVRLSMMLFV
ncbi:MULTISPECIES: poly-gamma-glutamate biosynthesis protein PgsC [unclassified Halanaerobium]|uniref:poly-gamma-glutamate biosynthesis protein PgsC n=1 Tax=unclassified Halanaerobium TaxID=2641197 RepID=UPI000DF2CC09|nr:MULTISPECIES: poly-gamma-glutamate biosynthesis protein PgsC [unclassified Halanaerobium]RCW49845.1 poly-gamma-glutamate biosynthesis protein PgsC/CapC [Halanaerobium sp. MA284_MarDTE_T2]RCW88489.1 poly-gamma-glutamate biosynthesis protein PgsC/CapC [Halanaerobium sp. DL-01]